MATGRNLDAVCIDGLSEKRPTDPTLIQQANAIGQQVVVVHGLSIVASELVRVRPSARQGLLLRNIDLSATS